MKLSNAAYLDALFHRAAIWRAHYQKMIVFIVDRSWLIIHFIKIRSILLNLIIIFVRFIFCIIKRFLALFIY
jgi:hypothetical protein